MGSFLTQMLPGLAKAKEEEAEAALTTPQAQLVAKLRKENAELRDENNHYRRAVSIYEKPYGYGSYMAYSGYEHDVTSYKSYKREYDRAESLLLVLDAIMTAYERGGLHADRLVEMFFLAKQGHEAYSKKKTRY